MDIGLSKWIYLLKPDSKLKITLNVLLMGFNTTGLIYIVSSVPYLTCLLMNYQ